MLKVRSTTVIFCSRPVQWPLSSNVPRQPLPRWSTSRAKSEPSDVDNCPLYKACRVLAGPTPCSTLYVAPISPRYDPDPYPFGVRPVPCACPPIFKRRGDTISNSDNVFLRQPCWASFDWCTTLLTTMNKTRNIPAVGSSNLSFFSRTNISISTSQLLAALQLSSALLIPFSNGFCQLLLCISPLPATLFLHLSSLSL
jgi:hypothetical protein